MLHAMKQKALSAAVADSLRNSPRDSPAVSLSGKAQGGKNSPVRRCPGLSCGLPRVRNDCSRSSSSRIFPPGDRMCFSLSLIQASSVIVTDLLGPEHESWKSGLGELRGEGLGFHKTLAVSVVVAIVCQSSGGLSHRSPVSQVSAPLLQLCCYCLPFIGTFFLHLSCSFCLPGLSDICFQIFFLFYGFDYTSLCC